MTWLRSWVSMALAATWLVHGAAHADDIQASLDALAARASPGMLGVEVLDLQDGRVWKVHADRDYPMMSVFKAPLGALVLSKVERHELTLDQQVTVTRADLRHGKSPIADRFHGDSQRFSLRQLLVAAVHDSDNTAADIVLRLAGGPAALTSFLHSHGIEGLRVDRGEGEIYNDTMGLDSHGQPPASETPQAQALRIQRGVAGYMADPRDRSTPDAAVTFLRKLTKGELLSAASTRQLLTMMTNSPPFRIDTGLPQHVTFAHKGGTSGTFNGMTPAFNDIGIAQFPDGHAVIVAAFMTGAHLSETDRAALFHDLGTLVGRVHPAPLKSSPAP